MSLNPEPLSGSDPRLVHGFQLASKVAAAGAALIGIAVLTGWALGGAGSGQGSGARPRVHRRGSTAKRGDIRRQARIFEPFFTTKAQGTGLGLATVRGVVTQNSGHISVYSEPGHGTTIKIYLPHAEKQPDAAAAAAPKKPGRGTETILLVEDNVDLREVSREFLVAAGYTVMEARSSDEALDIGRRYRKTIHLLLTDVVLPCGSGREIATEMSALRPEIAVLYMSGYTDSIVAQHGVLDPGIVLLQKPFTRNQLLSFVRDTLDAQRARPATDRLAPAAPIRVNPFESDLDTTALPAAASANHPVRK